MFPRRDEFGALAHLGGGTHRDWQVSCPLGVPPLTPRAPFPVPGFVRARRGGIMASGVGEKGGGRDEALRNKVNVIPNR